MGRPEKTFLPSTAALSRSQLAFPAPLTFACRARCLHLFMMLSLDHEVVYYI